MTELRDKLQHDLPPDASEVDRPSMDQVAAATEAESDGATGAKGGGGGSRAAPGRSEPMHSAAGNFHANDFSVWESHLALRLGVNRRDLIPVRQRHLEEGVHFVRKDRRVVYCAVGVDKLTALLTNGSVAEKSLPTAVLCEPRPELRLLKFHVRRKAINAHILECVDQEQKIVAVRVRDNANFLPGMEVSAVPYGDMPGVFEFAGAYPRFRGKY